MIRESRLTAAILERDSYKKDNSSPKRLRYRKNEQRENYTRIKS